ncbi:MAG: LacI family DNA-binding transcriptional regulator [Lachnospiraceae bacterium]|nr:LacI family DNA-binding transcriptional regulator [Lachnospiraceae bacterium]
MKRQNAPTMKDVAREAKVALGTVSKVINGIPVGEEYRVKVEAAIRKLNYEVNTYARGLKMQKSNTVTLIIPDAVNPFYASFAHYIESALYEAGHFMVLCCSGAILEKEIEYLNMASQNQSDGVIALTYNDIGGHVPESLPLVSFDRIYSNAFTPRVASDNFAGGVMAVEKLLECGCAHPAFITFNSPYPGEADKRKDGYLHACSAHNLEPVYLSTLSDANLVCQITDFIRHHRRADGSLAFDGIFVNTDYNAYITCNILREMGFRIPDDVQIIGFDGITKFGITKDLYVSSICQPIPELARTCVNMVLAKDKGLLPSLTLLPVSYRYGGTTRK